jgi:UPF0716 protein FxsA
MRISWAKWLLLGALALPIVEIVVFVAVAAKIGFVEAFSIQVACSLIGVVAIRSAGRVRLGHLRSQLGAGVVRTTQFDGVDLVKLLAGALLVVPGFLTDALGGLLLVPATRRGLGAMLRRVAARTGGSAPADRVIDLEPGEWHRQDSGVRGRESGRKSDPLLPDA